MAHFDSDVKRRCLTWIDRHPRTGWYLMVLLFLNYVLDVLTHFL